MLSKKKYFFVALLWTLIVTVLSLISIRSLLGFGNSINIANKDKIVHFFFYFVMIILWLNYCNKTETKNIYLKVFLAVVGYGILMEICQGVFTTNREADVFDAIVNTIGAIAGTILVKMTTNKN